MQTRRWNLDDSDLGGAVLSTRSSGSDSGGPALLCIHGLGGSSLNWVDLMGRLEGTADLLAVDLPGFGASPPPRNGDYSPRGHARHAAALARAWQRERGSSEPVHVIGNSLGGAVALQLAAAQPDLVASLTLLAPALPTRKVRRGNAHLPVAAIPGLGERLGRRYRRIDAAARVQMTMNACLSDPARVNPRVQELIVAEVRGRDELPYVGDALLSSLRGLLATFTDPTASRPWALARTLDLPVLVVYGSHDTLVDPRSAALASRAFRGSTVVVLPDCGHVAQMEWPDVVANLWQDTILDVNRPVPERAAP